MNLSKIIILFGRRKEKELHGLNHTRKSKMSNIAKMKLELSGMKTVH